MSKHSQVTSDEVAALAGVSRSAVSRAFTPGASIAENTKKKVVAAATKLGYQPNVIARSLIMNRSRLIGLIMADWDNPFYTTMLRQFSEKFQVHGYQVILTAVGKDKDIDNAIRLLLQYQVDGIVIVSALPSAAIAADCIRRKTPIVVVNEQAAGISASSVTCDAADCGRKIARRLLDGGYKRFALLYDDPDLQVGNEKNEAIEKTIEDRGIGRIVAQQSHISRYDDGRQAVARLMKQTPKPDAIVCSSDLVARGVLDGALIDLKIEVPGELGIVGFGDSPAASWGANRLTTIHLPIEEMIDRSIDTVIQQIAEPDIEPVNIVTIANIVERSTVQRAQEANK